MTYLQLIYFAAGQNYLHISYIDTSHIYHLNTCSIFIFYILLKHLFLRSPSEMDFSYTMNQGNSLHQLQLSSTSVTKSASYTISLGPPACQYNRSLSSLYYYNLSLLILFLTLAWVFISALYFLHQCTQDHFSCPYLFISFLNFIKKCINLR